jgi:hypothetical protein
VNDHELDLRLSELRAEVPLRDERARRLARQQLALGRPATPWHRRLAVPGLAAAAAAAAVVVAVVAATGVGHEPDASAAAALRQAAAKLAAAPAAELGPGQYWYVESQGHTMTTLVTSKDGSGPGINALMTTVHKEWIGRDGSGRIVRTDTDPQFVTPGDRQRWVDAGSPALGGGPPIDEAEPVGELSFPFGERSLTYEQLRALPSDPDALGRLVRDAAIQNGRSRAWEELDLIAELLRNSPLSPAQGAALYQVAASLDGIELIEHEQDPSGRAGVGIAVSDGGLRVELILDPETGVLLGDREVALEDSNVPAGTVIDAVSYVRSGVVDGVTQTP